MIIRIIIIKNNLELKLEKLKLTLYSFFKVRNNINPAIIAKEDCIKGLAIGKFKPASIE